ncbi:MAG TPA: hypothetical protein VJ835_12490 [Fimbriimonadaceae bacterium]|nr:hypothetical protein [Fimbriimonadaceae bacterium]
MFGALFYSIGCFFVAGVLTFVTTMFRPIQEKGESRPWRAFIFWFIFVTSAPYLYGEILTRFVVKGIDKPVKEAYSTVDINGPLQFYRVIWYTGDKAKVVAVGKEPQSWGGTDRPLVTFNMKKSGKGEWEVDSYRLVYSDRTNKDGITFPPYW